MYKLIYILLLCLSLFAQEENVTNSQEQTFFVNLIEKPDFVYKGQVFSIKLKAMSANGGDLKYALSGGAGVNLLNSDSKFKGDANNSYILSLYFKSTGGKITLPEIEISQNDQKLFLESQSIDIEEPSSSPYSCGVIASKLKVNSARIDSYNSANNIVLLDIVAQNANLTDFRFPNSAQQGVTQVKQSYPESQLFYFVTIPNTQNVIEFQYLNSSTKKLETVSVPLDLQKVKGLVSTQSDLQPKGKDKAIYVFIVVIILSAILYAIYYFKQDKIFLVLIGITLLIGGAVLFWPNKVAIVKKDCVAYLLPTESSTPFYKTSADIEVELLKQTDGFSKIELDNGRIGWVKDECVTKQ